MEWTVKDLIASQARVPGAGATPEPSCLSLWVPLTHEVHKAGADSSDLRVLSAGTRGAQAVRPLDRGQPLRHSLTGMLESLPHGSTARITGGGTGMRVPSAAGDSSRCLSAHFLLPTQKGSVPFLQPVVILWVPAPRCPSPTRTELIQALMVCWAPTCVTGPI